MALNNLRRRDTIVEQDMNDPNEQPRFWECFQCACHEWNPGIVSDESPRHRCTILDVENRKIVADNEKIINPAMRKELKRCIYHEEYNPEDDLNV